MLEPRRGSEAEGQKLGAAGGVAIHQGTEADLMDDPGAGEGRGERPNRRIGSTARGAGVGPVPVEPDAADGLEVAGHGERVGWP